ncbi:hypothetical protein [Egbenema bharatensis]|uniref:hypothetical protein n=1 Tax=Egbenema bharatensis TaxID=3463334 RepID=UPI003A87C7D8
MIQNNQNKQPYATIKAQHESTISRAGAADLAKGFTQLAVELIAIDQWAVPEQMILLGAVTTGDIWQFSTLDRMAKMMT